MRRSMIWHALGWVLIIGAVASAAVAQPPASLARTRVLVDTAWLAANLTRSDIRLIDVSSSKETYDRGHLPGAVYLSTSVDLVDPTHPVKGMAPTRAQFERLARRLGLRTTDAVILYDDARSVLAARAFWVFKLYRHERVAILDGGSGKWAAEGRPLTTASAPAAGTPSFYAAGARDDTIVSTAGDVLAKLGNVFLLDSRTPGEYAGLDVRAARGGHIPGAVNVEWTLAMSADGTFKSGADLRALYARAGVSRDRETVVYCQTGVRAAHAWFVLTYLLGYPQVRNYDGSWEEWGNRADLPVQR